MQAFHDETYHTRHKESVSMLILTRGITQKIILDNGTTITICGVNGGQVKVGIDAPDHVSIYREELVNKPRKKPNLIH